MQRFKVSNTKVVIPGIELQCQDHFFGQSLVVHFFQSPLSSDPELSKILLSM